MKFSIFYFSGTENTKWVVNEFNNSVNKRKHECKNYSIETEITNLQEIINEADIIGFTFPIYGANMPNIVTNFINKAINVLNTNYKKQCLIITTSGYIDAYGPFAARKKIKCNGLKLIGYINIKMSNNISTPKLRAEFSTSEEMKKRMNQGKKELEKLIDKIIQGKKHIRNVGFYLLPGIVVRKALVKALKKNYLALSVDKEKCSRCMLCVNNCPTKSIIFSSEEFSFLHSCTACMRCYNFCPKYAICHEGKYADPSIYRRYRGPQSIL